MAWSLPVIWVGDQSCDLRQINTTGKSVVMREAGRSMPRGHSEASSLPLVGRVGAQRRGGGVQSATDSFHHAVQFSIHIRIPESQNTKSLRSKESIAL